MLGKSSLREGKRGEVGAEVHAHLASSFLGISQPSFPREAQSCSEPGLLDSSYSSINHLE